MIQTIKKAYGKFCVVEEALSGAILCAIAALVFSSAVMRAIGHPILWAVDISTFMFAWEVFIGGDIVIRNTELGGVEIITNRLPSAVQKALKLIWFVLIIGFCAFLVVYGIDLCLSNTNRTFSTLAMSYSWCTLSVPVGSFLMIISSIIRVKEIIRTPASYWKQSGKAN